MPKSSFQLLLIQGLLTVWAGISSALNEDHVLHETRAAPLRQSTTRQRLHGDAILPMRIGLKSNPDALSNAESWLMAVSDPDSEDYGRFWSQDDVIQSFKPTSKSLEAVTNWLAGHGVTQFTYSDNKLWYAFDLPAGEAERMLQTEYFQHSLEDGTVEASCDSYYLPKDLRSHIDYITPGVKCTDITERVKKTSRKRTVAEPSNGLRAIDDVKRSESAESQHIDKTSLENCSHWVTPACIRALYNFSLPEPDCSLSENNSLGIFAAGDIRVQGALNSFFHAFTDIPAGTSPIYEGFGGAKLVPPDERGNGLFDSGEAMLDFECALPIIYPQNSTLFDAPYPPSNAHYLDFYNTFLDAIDGSYCHYGTQSNTSTSQLECGIFKPTNVLSLSYGSFENEFPELWQRRQCNEYLKLGLQGVSMFFCSQDWGTGLVAPGQHILECKVDPGHNIFMPAFPASCPWITSVGATQIGRNKTVYDREIAAHYYHHHKNTTTQWFASGGGFSINWDRPHYQDEAVLQYFDTSDPKLPYYYNGRYQNSSGLYNRNGRGFPDIAAVGLRLATYIGEEGFGLYPAYGTSASTPIVAALFNRIVEERLRVGKGPVGFVNPTLYKHQEVLNDILEGGNGNCCEGICGPEDGFECAPGWDPVTGLGTPKYPELLDLFMALP